MTKRVDTCAHCGVQGPVGTVLVPYLVDTKVRRSKDGKKVLSRKPIHRWLCGVPTGRECAAQWHEKLRAWDKTHSA